MLRRSLLSAFAFVALALATTGCSDGEPTAAAAAAGGSTQGPPELTIIPGAPGTPASEPDVESHDLDGYSTSMAGNGALVIAGTTTRAYGIGAAGPEPLSIVGDEPNLPLETGAIRAMASYGDGVLVAAESALFFTTGGALQLSKGSDLIHPLGVEAMTSRIADDDGDGVVETHLAIRSKSGAYELSSGATSMVAWKVEGEEGEPSAMLSQKDRLYLAFGRRVYEIEKATGKAYPLPFDVGVVSEMACGSLACDDGSLLYFASDRGLVERSPDGLYRLYTLADEGQDELAVISFALDASKQRLYALAGSRVMRVRAGEPPVAVATLGEATSPRSMAVDKIGDVWAGEGLSLRRLALGTPLSFATDVRPVMHEYCADCHAKGQNGAPALDFESYDWMVTKNLADVVVKRVSEGTMPPATYAKKLPKEKVQIVQDWAITKAP